MPCRDYDDGDKYLNKERYGVSESTRDINAQVACELASLVKILTPTWKESLSMPTVRWILWHEEFDKDELIRNETNLDSEERELLRKDRHEKLNKEIARIMSLRGIKEETS